VALSIQDSGTHVSVFVANDHPHPWEGTWCWSLETLEGEIVETGSEEVCASPISGTCLREFDFGRAVKKHGASRLVFTAGLYEDGKCLSRQTTLFAKEKNITFPNPELQWEMTQEGGQLVITIKANAFARYIELGLEGADVVFSDNFFDIPACHTVQIRCPLPVGWTLEQAKRALRVRSLADVVPAGSKTSNAVKHVLYGLKPSSLVTRILFNFIE
jgi:beta-mannosidase